MVVLLGGAAWYLYPTSAGEKVEIPSLQGKTLDEARAAVGENLKIEAEGDGGIVRSQEPAAGEQARPGDVVFVVLAPASTGVPDVVGMSRDEAEERLRSGGFDVEIQTQQGSEDEIGKVIEQDPPVGEAEEASKVTLVVGAAPESDPDYASVKEGALSMEVPADWEVQTGAESEGSGSSWSLVLGSAETSITAAPDLEAWHGSAGATGMYAVASRALVGYTNEQVIITGPNDLSGVCTLGDARDFVRESYSARIQTWTDCGGDAESNNYTVAIAPVNRECVVALRIGAIDEAERDTAQHIMDTLEIDCAAIAEVPETTTPPPTVSEAPPEEGGFVTTESYVPPEETTSP